LKTSAQKDEDCLIAAANYQVLKIHLKKRLKKKMNTFPFKCKDSALRNCTKSCLCTKS